MIRFAHLINPVSARPPSDLCVAQPITFETMRRARERLTPGISVELLAAVYPEDREMVPEGFEVRRYLDRSVLDLHDFQVPRKLPLLADLLQSLHNHSSADWLVFTNSDIALMPYFYSSLQSVIRDGYDAFVINRRTISACWTSISQIPMMYADVGEPHVGYDCFVFHRDLFKEFNLRDVCVGAAWVGRTLLANMVACSNRFREYRDLHLTFHLGDNRSWRNPHLMDYTRHNQEVYFRIFPELEKKSKRLRHPVWRSYLVDTGETRQFPDFD